MTCVTRALIIGGGIAGLSTAIALSRIGVSCDVVELGTHINVSDGADNGVMRAWPASMLA